MVFHEVSRSFVDCIVSQVHEKVVQVGLSWSCVFLGCEAGQPFLEHKDTKWVYAEDEHINSQIELQVVYQVWFCHVALRHKLVPRLHINIFKTPGQVDSLTLAHVDRLDDESLGLFLVKLVLEIILVRWEHPRLREEAKVIFEGLFHACEIPGEVVLAGEGLHTRLAIDPLVRSKLAYLLRLHSYVRPKQVPICVHVLVELVLHLATDSLDNIVAGNGRAEDEFLVGLLLAGGLSRGGLRFIVLRIRLSFRLLFYGAAPVRHVGVDRG